MKKGVILVIILIIVFGGIGGGIFGYIKYQEKKENERIEEIKEGWYVEILSDTLNVRKEASTSSSKVATVEKGEVYTVLEIEAETKYIWYYIEYEDDAYGWIANTVGGDYLNDVNDPEDMYTPTIKFNYNVYYTESIDTITYDHLTVWDDKGIEEITHQVFHEVDTSQNIDQYWIQYTVTDTAGKYAKKVQKIVFEETPDESLVEDFNNLVR